MKKNETLDLKSEIIKLLTPIFGIGIKKTLEDYYDNNLPQEIVDLAQEMLDKYMGKQNADRLLSKILANHSELKVKVALK